MAKCFFLRWDLYRGNQAELGKLLNRFQKKKRIVFSKTWKQNWRIKFDSFLEKIIRLLCLLFSNSKSLFSYFGIEPFRGYFFTKFLISELLFREWVNGLKFLHTPKPNDSNPTKPVLGLALFKPVHFSRKWIFWKQFLQNSVFAEKETW